MTDLEADKKALETIKKLHLASKKAIDDKRMKGNILDLFSSRDLEKVSDDEYKEKLLSYHSLSLKNVSINEGVLVNNHNNIRWGRFKDELPEETNGVISKIKVQTNNYLVIETTQKTYNRDAYGRTHQENYVQTILIDGNYNVIKCKDCSSAKKSRYIIIQEFESELYGIYDTKELTYTVPPSFTEIKDMYFDGDEGYFIGKSENLYGVFNLDSVIVIPPMFSDINVDKKTLLVKISGDNRTYQCGIDGEIIKVVDEN